MILVVACFFLLFLHEGSSFSSSFQSLHQRKPAVSISKFSAISPSKTELISSAEPKKESEISASTFNLAKSIIGAGVLSLPSGVAFFADESSALIPSAVLCSVFGSLAAYSFSTVGKICKEYNAKSFQEAWAKSVSPSSAKVISGVITALTFLAVLAYSIIIGDSFTTVFQVIDRNRLF